MADEMEGFHYTDLGDGLFLTAGKDLRCERELLSRSEELWDGGGKVIFEYPDYCVEVTFDEDKAKRKRYNPRWKRIYKDK